MILRGWIGGAEGTGWIEGGSEGMGEEAVLEGKEQEQESERVEIGDEWVGVWIVGIKEKKAQGKEEDRMKVVTKQEVAPAKTALGEEARIGQGVTFKGDGEPASGERG